MSRNTAKKLSNRQTTFTVNSVTFASSTADTAAVVTSPSFENPRTTRYALAWRHLLGRILTPTGTRIVTALSGQSESLYV